MTEEQVRAVLLDVLREVQSVSGRGWNDDLGLEAKPIGNLDAFDSLSAVEATVMMEEKLGCKLEIESVFVSEDGKRALTIKEISARVSRILARNAGAS